MKKKKKKKNWANKQKIRTKYKCYTSQYIYKYTKRNRNDENRLNHRHKKTVFSMFDSINVSMKNRASISNVIRKF